ncbi:MAG: transglycosylase SLT domain-containing protein [Acidobacteriaceae bacterium]|nr:transglycosylase SLT domain-containing protein [Acidobacteriaceae bacterium]
MAVSSFGSAWAATGPASGPAVSPAAHDPYDAPSNETPDATAFGFLSSVSPNSDDSSIHSPETDERLSRADSHFNAGRQLYFEGDLDGARSEFDSAVDVLLTAPDNLPDRRRIERRLDEICDLVYRFDIEKLGSGRQEDDAVAFDEAPIDEISHMTFPVDEKLAPKLKTELNQTSSGIPLDLTDPVLSYVHYFSADRGRQVLLAGFRRSGRYKPLIEKIFTEEGVPQELIYLAQAESGFLPRAVSRKSAVGMWQFISETGANYDLVHTSTFDERFDPEKATRAAAHYLKDLRARYGDWYLALAAYNCGPGGVDRAIERTGYADYWELLKRHALPKETANYVPIIVAMTIMAKNPQDYGLENIETDVPVEYDSIQLAASTNLNLIADATMQPLSVIRDLNPSILRTIAPAGFSVHVPKGTGSGTQAALETVPPENRNAWRLHHVESGDTLAAIARSYHLAPQKIVAVNRAADSLEAGDVLLIPAAYHEEMNSRRMRTAHGRIHHPVATTKSATGRNRAHVAATRHVPAQVLHRKAALRTASLE